MDEKKKIAGLGLEVIAELMLPGAAKLLKLVQPIVHQVHVQRIENFLMSINTPTEELDEFLDTEEKKEIFTDYCRSACTTKSVTAIKMLALIFRKFHNNTNFADKFFLNQACKALLEISDEILEFFYIVSDKEKMTKITVNKDIPY